MKPSFLSATGRAAPCGLLCLAALVLAAPVVHADTVEVAIDGIDDPLLANVRGTLSIAQAHEEPWSASQIQRLHRLARSEAQNALAPFGYYNPDIATTLTPPRDGAQTSVWQAAYEIDAGPPTIVQSLDLAVTGPGDDFPAIADVVSNSDLRSGERLLHSDYNATKNALAAAAYDAGYLDAGFIEAAIRVDPDANTAEIDLIMATGERYYFGDVAINQDVLAPEFVQKFVPIKPGQPFDAERLIDLQLILSDTDYFGQILIDAERDEARRAAPVDVWLYDLIWPPEDPLASIGQLRVPIRVDAEASKPQRYTVSAGYGTDTGPRVGFGVKFRHLNEDGHQFRTDLRLSAIERTLRASYDVPIENVIQDRLSYTAQVSNQEYGDLTTNRFGIGAVRDTGWALGRKRAYIKLQREIYDLEDGAGDRTSTLLYPGYTITLRKADSLLQTRKGLGLSLDVHGGSEAVASSTDFVQARATGSFILPLTERSRLLLRGELGATEVSDFDDLPPSQRFFAGGDSSVRGYGYQQLSPTSGDDINVGGQYLAVASIETDYFFYKDYGLAAFFDMGNASNSTSFDLKRGVGVGFRWASPVGMIRLDLAHPLDDPDTDFRIHFSLGSTL